MKTISSLCASAPLRLALKLETLPSLTTFNYFISLHID